MLDFAHHQKVIHGDVAELVEGTALEKRHTGNRIVSSNLTISAKSCAVIAHEMQVKIFMLTDKQEEWINHLSDETIVKITPFDPSSEEKFKKVKSLIQSKLGLESKVEHHGATSLGISGQDEIDVYVPVSKRKFNDCLSLLKGIFDEPRSHYPLDRARFVTSVDGKHVDIFLINMENSGWTDCVKFENLLKKTPEALEEYRALKEAGDGLSVKEYYRRKIEFINRILAKT